MKSPPAPSQLNRRIAGRVGSFLLTWVAYPDGQNEDDVVNGPSCSRFWLCFPSKTRWKEGAAPPRALATITAGIRARASAAVIRLSVCVLPITVCLP